MPAQGNTLGKRSLDDLLTLKGLSKLGRSNPILGKKLQVERNT